MAMQGALRQGTVLDLCGLAVCPALPLQVSLGVWLCAPVRLPRILGPDRPHLQAKVQGVPGYPTCNAIGLYRTRP
jgi:hypothetical protein